MNPESQWTKFKPPSPQPVAKEYKQVEKQFRAMLIAGFDKGQEFTTSDLIENKTIQKVLPQLNLRGNLWGKKKQVGRHLATMAKHGVIEYIGEGGFEGREFLYKMVTDQTQWKLNLKRPHEFAKVVQELKKADLQHVDTPVRRKKVQFQMEEAISKEFKNKSFTVQELLELVRRLDEKGHTLF